jgi:hypothetical protein
VAADEDWCEGGAVGVGAAEAVPLVDGASLVCVDDDYVGVAVAFFVERTEGGLAVFREAYHALQDAALGSLEPDHADGEIGGGFPVHWSVPLRSPGQEYREHP